MILVGSKARGSKTARDLDFITNTNLNEVIFNLDQLLSKKFGKLKILKKGPKHISVYTDDTKIDVWRWRTPQERIFMYFARTGNKQFNIRARRLAKLKGYKLTDTGLFEDGKRINVRNEKDLFKKLGITYRRVKDRTY